VARSARRETPLPSTRAFRYSPTRIHQYNVTYDAELGWASAIRFSYLGSTMHGLIAGKDLNELQPSDTPFGTNALDPDTGETIPGQYCDPTETPFLVELHQNSAVYRFPALGDFVLSTALRHAQSNAFQTQFEHHYAHGLSVNIAYTYLDQKSTALDTGQLQVSEA